MCVDKLLIYLVTCTICEAQYVGQTTNEMRKRHYGHRAEIRGKVDGLGEHFYKHAEQKNLDLRIPNQMEKLMDNFDLTIVGSVEAGKPWSQRKLDDLEADLQHRFQALEQHGGIGLRDETRRKR